MRAHFDYTPKNDRLIPSQEAGLDFKKGDILRVLNQDDSFWWQVHLICANLIGVCPTLVIFVKKPGYKAKLLKLEWLYTLYCNF